MQVENDNFLEEKVGTLLMYAYPKAYVALNSRTIGTSLGATKPDLVFGWRGQARRVFIELTTSSYPGNEHKRKQRDRLMLYAETHPDHEALIFYLQNLAALSGIIPSFTILEKLARGKVSTKLAQGQIDDIARCSSVPYYAHSNDVNWETLYLAAKANITPRG